MTRPRSISEYPKIDLKLGIKSSITDTKSFISAITMLYMSDNKPAQIQYSQASGTSIVATATIENALKAYMSSAYSSKGITDTEFIDKINSSPIFKAQIEHLNVGSELIWRLGRFIFINSSQNMSAERTGTTRFPKEIVFSSNMDIISSLIKMDEPNYKEVLLSWLGLGKIISGTPVETAETNLKQVLNIFAENAFFKLRDGDKDVIFNQSGIYAALNISTNVDINGDEESKGSLRIIKKAAGIKRLYRFS